MASGYRSESTSPLLNQHWLSRGRPHHQLRRPPVAPPASLRQSQPKTLASGRRNFGVTAAPPAHTGGAHVVALGGFAVARAHHNPPPTHKPEERPTKPTTSQPATHPAG